MSIKIQSRVWENSHQSGGTLLVLLALADFADDNGFCYPSLPVIAKKARLSDRQTQRAIQALQEAGELDVMPGQGVKGQGGYTNRFKITVREVVTLVTPVTKLHRCHTRRKVVTSVTRSGDVDVTQTVRNHQESSSPTPSWGTGHEEEETYVSDSQAIAFDESLPAEQGGFTAAELDCPPVPPTGTPRPRQPFQTRSQAQEQAKRRGEVFATIYAEVRGVALPSAPAPGTLKKYAEALDWFVSSSITAEQISVAVAAAKAQWRNLERPELAINPRSLADNWHLLYTPPKPSAAKPSQQAPATPAFDWEKPLCGLSKRAFIDHFLKFTPVKNWELMDMWAEQKPHMAESAVYARELILAADKAKFEGRDVYAVDVDVATLGACQ